ncbi:MAG TPA: Flp pilus assembly protein CpaB [Steroidobacteraceae bacterium]|nr:Flp pilus assembly protein CpaB [Steroidobacteraceae bacterium]
MEDPGRRWRRWLRTDVLLTVAGAGAGVMGAMLGAKYLADRAAAADAAAASRYQTREIVVAATDVPRGQRLGRNNLALRKVPQDFIPADAIPASGAGAVMGSRAAIDMARGTPILSAALDRAGNEPYRLSGALAPDERALTVAVDELSSQAGGVSAGDRIDLFYGRRDGSEAMLVPLLQQVEVLVAGDAVAPGTDDGLRSRHFATVTLRVSADDAPRVLLAQQAGDLFMLLRAPGDDALQPVAVRNSRELLRRQQARPVVAGTELLTGGTGELFPSRTWLTPGQGRDAS